MVKRILSVVICLAMLIPTLYITGAAKDKVFDDVAEDKWYTESVYWCVDRGYFSGTSANAFSPDSVLTRAQIVTVLSQIEGVDKDSYKGKDYFSDVKPGSWYEGPVNWAKESGVVTGVSATKFAPDSAATREQLCVIFNAYLKYKALIMDETVTDKEFVDSNDISAWAKAAVSSSVRRGLISGDANGRLDPKGNLTRGMAAVMVKSFSDKLATAKKPQLIAYYNAGAYPVETELAYVDVINFHPATVNSTDSSSSSYISDVYSSLVPDLRKRAAEDYGNDDLKIVFTVASNNIGVFETVMVQPAFADAILSRVKQYGFDGVDIDYEFPQIANLDERGVAQKQGWFVNCMKRIRDGLDKLSEETGKEYTLSMAVPGGSWAFTLYDMKSLANLVDYFNIMNYDTYVNRGVTLHHTSPYDNAILPGATTVSDIALYANNGIPASMVVPGCGMYSRRWTGVEPGPNGDGLYQPGTVDPSNIHLSEILSTYVGPKGTGVNGYTKYWDDNAKAPYLYNPTTKTFLSYDDLDSVSYKIELVQEAGVRGLMLFDYITCDMITVDRATGKTLIQTIYERLTKSVEK